MAQEYLPAPSNVRLADLMKEHNISQPELAKEIGCSKSTISRFISGAKGTLTHEQVLRIARLFNVSTDFLLGETNIPDRKNYDIAELGLSVEAAKNLYTGRVNTEVVNLLLDGVSNVFYQIQREREITDAWYDFLKEYRQKLKNSLQAKGIFETILAEKTASDEQNEKQQFVSKTQSELARSLNEKLKECAKKIAAGETDNIEETALFALAKAPFDAQCEKLQSLENQGIETLEHAFTFMEQAFSDGQEMVVFVTELTITPEIAVFLSEHRIERYETYKNQLLIGTKRAEILSEIARD